MQTICDAMQCNANPIFVEIEFLHGIGHRKCMRFIDSVLHIQQVKLSDIDTYRHLWRSLALCVVQWKIMLEAVICGFNIFTVGNSSFENTLIRWKIQFFMLTSHRLRTDVPRVKFYVLAWYDIRFWVLIGSQFMLPVQLNREKPVWNIRKIASKAKANTH